MSQHIAFQRLEGVAIFVTAAILYFFLDFHWLIFVLFLFAFDIFMIGYLVNRKVGAVTYNIGHSLILPSVSVAIGVLIGSQFLIGLSLLWFTHIGIDRTLGYGLKNTTGFHHTHLGEIGNTKKS